METLGVVPQGTYVLENVRAADGQKSGSRYLRQQEYRELHQRNLQ